jgi:HEPN domain-containing protein
MSDSSNEVLAVGRQWIEKAENDLIIAEHILTLEDASPTDAACFHAQQSVEKYVKALLVLHSIDFARVHHIGALVRLLPESIRLDLSPEEQERFTDYAVTTRYPGDYDPISLSEARRAVKTARRVRDQIRAYLSLWGVY